jgi:hypothetical protein
MQANKFDYIVLNRQPNKYDHRDFRLGDYITAAKRQLAAVTTQREWEVAKILDQGDTPHCVGFAWAGFGISLPVADLLWNNATGDSIYYTAKVIDGEPKQENGSSTRSGVQAFMRYGSLQGNSYAFANSLQDIITWVLTSGPVITGTNWYNQMFNPDAQGVVTVGGGVAGGHEWMISGVDTTTQLFKCTNSWGAGFAKSGQFYISFSDYQRLLNEQGDACTALEVPAGPTPPPPPPTPNGCLAVATAGLSGMVANLQAVSDPERARFVRALNLAVADLKKKN